MKIGELFRKSSGKWVARTEGVITQRQGCIKEDYCWNWPLIR